MQLVNFQTGYAHNQTESQNPEFWDGIIGAWMPSFGNQGGILYDITGKKNTGVLVSLDATDYVGGSLGNALKFTVLGERVNMGVAWWNSVMHGANAASIVVGIKYNVVSTSDHRNTVFEAFNSKNALLIRSNGDSKQLQVGGRSKSSDSYQSADGTTDLSTLVGKDIQLTCILDYQNDKILAYINGNEEINSSVSFGSSTYNADGSSSTNDCLAGSGSSTRYLEADIAYAYIYNYRLSQSQVTNLWQDPFAAFQKKIYVVGKTPAADEDLGNATGNMELSSSCELSASDTIEASGNLEFDASASVGSDDSLAASGNMELSGSCEMSGEGGLSGSGDLELSSSANMAGDGELSGSGNMELSSSANLEADDTIEAAGNMELSSSAILGSDDSLSASGNMEFSSSADLEEDQISATGNMELSSSVELSSDDSLSATGNMELDGTAEVTDNADSGISATGNMEWTSSCTMSGEGSISATGDMEIDASTVLGSDDSFSSTGAMEFSSNATVGADDSLSASGNLEFSGLTVIDGEGFLSGVGALLFSGSATISDFSRPITIKIMDELATQMASEMTIANGYNFEWGSVNEFTKSEADYPLSYIALGREDNTDLQEGLDPSLFHNEITIIWISEYKHTGDIADIDRDKFAYQMRDDHKRFVDNHFHLSDSGAQNIWYVNSEPSHSNSKTAPVSITTTLKAEYRQERLNPSIAA